VTIVSPNPALRIGLRELLSGQTELNVISEAASVDELDDSLEEDADVLVLASVSPAGMSSLKNIPAILILTDDAEDVQTIQDSSAKAWGVIPLNATEDELVAAVRAVGEGLWVGAPGLVRGLMRKSSRVELINGESLLEPLTARETEVLQLMAQGMANKQIAVALNISEHTVKFHLSSLYAKLSVSSRTEAVRVGLGHGLISL